MHAIFLQSSPPARQLVPSFKGGCTDCFHLSPAASTWRPHHSVDLMQATSGPTSGVGGQRPIVRIRGLPNRL